MIAVCINVSKIMFNAYIPAVAYFDGSARAAILIAAGLRIALTLFTDSLY